ncbi:MAG: hypothetical protein ABJP25_20280 [Sneathiella sp.]
MPNPKIEAPDLDRLGELIEEWAYNGKFPRTMDELAAELGIPKGDMPDLKLKPILVAPDEYPMLIPSNKHIDDCRKYLTDIVDPNGSRKTAYPVSKYYRDKQLLECQESPKHALDFRKMEPDERKELQLHRIGEYCLNICM